MSDNTDTGGYVPLFVNRADVDYDAYLGIDRVGWNNPDMLNQRIHQAKRAADNYSAMADTVAFEGSVQAFELAGKHALKVGDICARRLAVLNDAARRGTLDEVMA